MSPRWTLKPFEAERISALSREAAVPTLVAQLLINRGIDDPAVVRDFLKPKRTALHDPELMPGLVDAAGRIVRAIRDGRKIVIYGDYDVDGVCGTTILWNCLRLAGATNLDYYIPHRVEEGYGVNEDALRSLSGEHGAQLVITVDCGISAVRQAKLARDLGLELIITDHHTIGEAVPEADAVVHPRLAGGIYPFGELCGCGVAFKLAWQVAKQFGDGKKASPQMRQFLVEAFALVALATVADVVPLVDENRVFVHYGLALLRDAPSEGLRALMDVAKCAAAKISTRQVGFQLGPRINAAGRLDAARQAVEMLTTTDPDRARQLAGVLDELNIKRRAVEAEMVSEARAMVDALPSEGRRAIVVSREGWHPGVVGIVASRLVDYYNVPAIVLALDGEHGQGSGRTAGGLNLYDALHACSEGLTTYGGHHAAAGLRLPVSALAGFAQRFDDHCRRTLSAEALGREIVIDAEVQLAMLTAKIVEQVATLEPHGQGNREPMLSARNVRVVGDPRQVGDGKHLKFRVAQGGSTFPAIAFGMGIRIRSITPGLLCSIAFRPTMNEWNGRSEVQLEVKDIQAADAASQVPGAVA